MSWWARTAFRSLIDYVPTCQRSKTPLEVEVRHYTMLFRSPLAAYILRAAMFPFFCVFCKFIRRIIISILSPLAIYGVRPSIYIRQGKIAYANSGCCSVNVNRLGCRATALKYRVGQQRAIFLQFVTPESRKCVICSKAFSVFIWSYKIGVKCCHI